MSFTSTLERHLPPDRLSSWALTGAGCGLVAEVGWLPEWIRALLLLAFVFGGPGSVVIEWMGTLPLVAVRALVPVTGLSIVILAVSGGLLLGFWSSRLTLLVLVLLTAAGGWINRRRAGSPGTNGSTPTSAHDSITPDSTTPDATTPDATTPDATTQDATT